MMEYIGLALFVFAVAGLLWELFRKKPVVVQEPPVYEEEALPLYIVVEK